MRHPVYAKTAGQLALVVPGSEVARPDSGVLVLLPVLKFGIPFWILFLVVFMHSYCVLIHALYGFMNSIKFMNW